MLDPPPAEIAGSVVYISIRVAERAQLDTLRKNIEAFGGELHVDMSIDAQRFATA